MYSAVPAAGTSPVSVPPAPGYMVVGEVSAIGQEPCPISHAAPIAPGEPGIAAPLSISSLTRG